MSYPAWQPTTTPEMLQLRSDLLWSIRQFFHARGLVEVQTPVLSRDTVIDRHIDPVSLPAANLGLGDLGTPQYFLQTSPEFAMKRLLAAGMKNIYQVAQVFRSAERGMFHNPEFTMVEWYRCGDDLAASVRLLRELIQDALNIGEVAVSSYQQAFQQYADCDPLAADVATLCEVACANKLGVDGQWSQDRDDWLNLIFSEVVQPQLGHPAPHIVTHYPASQSALARVSPEDARTAERYELFIQGVELANGYHELLEAEELMARNQTVAAQRAGDGKSPLPAGSQLVSAMRSGLPACSGCALGLDRLVMVASNARLIDDVIAFPIERA